MLEIVARVDDDRQLIGGEDLAQSMGQLSPTYSACKGDYFQFLLSLMMVGRLRGYQLARDRSLDHPNNIFEQFSLRVSAGLLGVAHEEQCLGFPRLGQTQRCLHGFGCK